MVVGVPNVGKSSLINTLSSLATQRIQVQIDDEKEVTEGPLIIGKPKLHQSNLKVGRSPGVTRHVSSVRLNHRPPVYCLDTPGVMLPNVTDLEVGVKLALTGAVADKIVPFTALADYLFEKCMEKDINIFGPLRVSRCSTSEEFLTQVAQRHYANAIEDRIEAAGFLFVRTFRRGELPVLCLD